MRINCDEILEIVAKHKGLDLNTMYLTLEGEQFFIEVVHNNLVEEKEVKFEMHADGVKEVE